MGRLRRRAQLLAAQLGEAAVGLAIEQPAVEVGRERGAIGPHQIGLAIAGEGGRLSELFGAAPPLRRLEAVRHGGVEVAREQRLAHGSVVGDREQRGAREVLLRHLLEVAARIHADAQVGTIQLLRRVPALGLAQQQHRSALDDRHAEAAGERALAAGP